MCYLISYWKQKLYFLKTEHPRFEKIPKPLEVAEKNDVVMSFRILGIPKPTIHIMKDDLDFPTDNRVMIHHEEKELVITVKDTTRADTGKYKIIIKNDLGEADASVDVLIYGMFLLIL